MTDLDLAAIPRTTSEFMRAAAAALRSGDAMELDRLGEICRDWMQTREELEAQLEMLAAMLEALEGSYR